MAFQLDSNIPLLARGVDVAGSIQQGVKTSSMLEQLRQSRAEAPIREDILNQLLAQRGQEFSAGAIAQEQSEQAFNTQQEQGGKLFQDQQEDRLAAQELLKKKEQKDQLADQEAAQNKNIKSIANTYSGIKGMVDGGRFNDAADALEANRQVLIQAGATDLQDTDEAIASLRSGDAARIKNIKTLGEQAIQLATDRGLLSDAETSAADKAFNSNIKNFTPEQKKKAREIRAGLAPRAVGSAATTIAETGKTDIVANSKSSIAAAVATAKREAESKGETLSELQIANASMPSLISVVDELKQLAPIATSTIGGNVFDAIAKEVGFGATEGSTAKAKFSSVVNNQILPLLKQTFGAAFTKAEGDELKATMGNVDAAPAEKIAQLNSFIDGKIREIQTKERQLGQAVTTSADITSQDTGITAEEFRAMTPAQRAAALQQLGGSQ